MSGCAVGLIALGVGYLVFLQGSKEKEGLKLLGQVIGIVIMVASILAGLCVAKCKMFGGKAPMCPITGKMLDAAGQ